MGELEKYYRDRIDFVSAALKKCYAKRIKNGWRDEIGTHRKIHIRLSIIHIYLQNKYRPNNFELINLIEESFKENKNGKLTTFDEAIIYCTKDANSEERKEKLKKIGLIQAYSNFFGFLSDNITNLKQPVTTEILSQPAAAPEKKIQLSDFFENEQKYKSIMNLLVEKGYCQQDTNIWKDETKGWKGLLSAILKYLHTQGYYKDNTNPTIEQIEQISKNTFGVNIRKDTIKKANPQKVDVSFIPPASTLN